MARLPHTDDASTLTPLMFQILLALSEGALHGYAIMQQIEERTSGAFSIGAGSLYRAIKQLVDAGIIVEVRHKSPAHRQRRYYRLTAVGRRRLVAEAKVFNDMVVWAREAQVLDPRAP